MPRPPVTGARLEEFLRRLGRDFHGNGRLYLVGGAQMVRAGLRRQTQGVDYTVCLERESLRIDEGDFRRKFAAFLNLLAAQGSGDTPTRP